MATNPIGKDTKTIGINMSAKMADDLDNQKYVQNFYFNKGS